MADDETSGEGKDTTGADSGDGGSLGGKIKEKLGWLTADRMMEGEGRVQQAAAAGLTGNDEGDDDGAAVADQAELQVRADYDEVHPDVEPE